MKLYFDKDADICLIQRKKLGFIGYGSQGRAHALNLRDSGAQDIKIGLYANSKSANIAKADGFEVDSAAEVVKRSDFLVIAVPDEKQSDLYKSEIKPHIKSGASLCFIHGFNIHFGLINPSDKINVLMVAPKGPGYAVREEYLNGRGTLCLAAVHQDATGESWDLALSYGKALGCGRAAIIETSFRDETIGDLFGEQAVLCGGLVELVRAGYDVLVESGISPHIAYLECVHEVKLIADLIYKQGIANMNSAISNTAEWGEYVAGKKIIDDSVRKNMRDVLHNIMDGSFASEWKAEYDKGLNNLHKYRDEAKQSNIEKTGQEIRNLLPWLNK